MIEQKLQTTKINEESKAVNVTEVFKPKSTVLPDRFSVRGMRRHPGVITSRNPRVRG